MSARASVLVALMFCLAACRPDSAAPAQLTVQQSKSVASESVASDSDAGSPAAVTCGPKGATYTACGCGCCGVPSKDDFVCVDTSKGETLALIQERDAAMKKSKNCMVMGCSRGTVYKCCD